MVKYMGKYSIHLEHLLAWGTQPPSLWHPLLASFAPRWKDRLGDFYLRGKREVEKLQVYGVPYQQEGGWLGGFFGVPTVGLGVETSSPKFWVFFSVSPKFKKWTH